MIHGVFHEVIRIEIAPVGDGNLFFPLFLLILFIRIEIAPVGDGNNSVLIFVPSFLLLELR